VRHGNLLALHDRACQFDRFARQGLSQFLRFIDQLQEEEGDFGPARVLTESQNVVRIMSIHQSKGLEFPVVIVGDLGRKMNQHHSKDRILFDHREPGSIGLKIVDPLRQDRWDTLAYREIADDVERRELAEEMRLLYVAMTRAGQRLILAASLDLSAAQQSWGLWRFDQENPLPEFALTDAKKPIDWIGMALAGHRDFQEFLDDAPDESGDSVFDVTVYQGTDVYKILEEEKADVAKPPSHRKLEDLLGDPADEKLGPEVQSVVDRIDWRYPHKKLCSLLARTSVTDLKHRLEVERELDFIVPTADRHHVFQRQPRFISEQMDKPTAAEVGSWTHLFLRHLDLADRMDETRLGAQLDGMIKRNIFTEQQGQTVDLDSVMRLFADSMGRDILTRRSALEREWTFTLAVPAGELYPDSQLTPDERKERVLVRGIIDCLFRTDQGYVIVDYKTDEIDGPQCDQRAATYRIPMNLYRRAVETILSEPVLEMYLYFLKPGRRVPMMS
ncbi:MAG: PD-(D/E)XK nuclease family protein, partial [Planctomycetes bacterium]|nr:PD-(D/E)XK nuclease family protein [Planctomycetota bacterium]